MPVSRYQSRVGKPGFLVAAYCHPEPIRLPLDEPGEARTGAKLDNDDFSRLHSYSSVG